jgi:hypothetical protein
MMRDSRERTRDDALAALEGVGFGGRYVLYEDLRALLAAAPSPLITAERAIALAVVDRMAADADEDLLAQRDAVRRLVELAPPWNETPLQGTANVLVAANRRVAGVQLGAVQPLRVTVEGWSQQPILARLDVGPAFSEALRFAARAATQWLMSNRELGMLRAAYGLNALGFVASLPRLLCPIDGPSVGLGAGLAILSEALELPISGDVAFTGQLHTDGTIGAVNGIEAKLAAAADKGLGRVLLPGGAGGARANAGLTIQEVGTLGAAMRALFEASAIRDGVERFRARLLDLPEPGTAGRFAAASTDARAGWRILVSCIGKRDPWPSEAPRCGPERPAPPEPGALVTLARELRPNEVHLVFTTNDEDDARRVDGCEAQLHEDLPGVPVRRWPLEGVTDPTDYGRLFPALRGGIGSVLADAARREEVTTFVNASSGTPQMMVSLLLLVERFNPYAAVMQVREGRYVPEGESRVRQVSIPMA